MSTITATPQYLCGRCNTSFNTRSERTAHKRVAHHRCESCSARFDDLASLRDHQTRTTHCFCQQCNIHFSSRREHLDHVRTTKHHTQYLCCDCGREYISDESLSRHCCDCDRLFRSQAGLQKHYASHRAHHGQRPTVQRTEAVVEGPHKCKKCSESFRSKAALKRHKPKHKPIRHIPCPVGKKCKKFASASALLSHLESGSCSSKMTRTKLKELVFSNDLDRVITDSSIIEDSPAGVTSRYFNAPSITSAMLTEESRPPTRTRHLRSDSIDSEWSNIIASERSDDIASEWSVIASEWSVIASEWSVIGAEPVSPSTGNQLSRGIIIDEDHEPKNRARRMSMGDRRCGLCPPTRKPFRSAIALQAHMTSAAHAPRVFHCPSVLMGDNPVAESLSKIKYFSTLSGLAQHLESGACRGGLATFKKAIEYVEQKLQLLGLGSIKLLSA
jgi:hypothetical protein